MNIVLKKYNSCKNKHKSFIKIMGICWIKNNWYPLVFSNRSIKLIIVIKLMLKIELASK
jgi:hypothetical protein